MVAKIPVLLPQGLAITRKPGAAPLLWVGSDGDGVLSAFDTATFALKHTVNFSLAPDVGEADDLQVDDLTQDILVAVGDDGPGSTDPSAIATVDASTGMVTASVATPGHIEGFKLVKGTNLVLANSPHAEVNNILTIA